MGGLGSKPLTHCSLSTPATTATAYSMDSNVGDGVDDDDGALESSPDSEPSRCLFGEVSTVEDTTLQAALEENEYLKLVHSDALREIAFVREQAAETADQKCRLEERLAALELADAERHTAARSD